MEEEGNLGAGGEGIPASQPDIGESPVLRLCLSLILFLGFIAFIAAQTLL